VQLKYFDAFVNCEPKKACRLLRTIDFYKHLTEGSWISKQKKYHGKIHEF